MTNAKLPEVRALSATMITAWRNGIDRFFSKDNFAIAATKMGSME
jgi:hypothetical protein